MSVKKQLTFFITIVFCFQLLGQESAVYTNSLGDYQKALQLYNSQQYLASQNLFSQIKKETQDQNVKSNCAFYIANAAIRLNQQNADVLMERFVEDYPTSTKKIQHF